MTSQPSHVAARAIVLAPPIELGTTQAAQTAPASAAPAVDVLETPSASTPAAPAREDATPGRKSLSQRFRAWAQGVWIKACDALFGRRLH